MTSGDVSEVDGGAIVVPDDDRLEVFRVRDLIVWRRCRRWVMPSVIWPLARSEVFAGAARTECLVMERP